MPLCFTLIDIFYRLFLALPGHLCATRIHEKVVQGFVGQKMLDSRLGIETDEETQIRVELLGR